MLNWKNYKTTFCCRSISAKASPNRTDCDFKKGHVSLAIYSCNHGKIGRTTHAAGTAGAHILYIGRDGADAVILAHGMPDEPKAACSWMNDQELSDRKNARVIDKIRIALPRELSESQREKLVQDYLQDMTQGQVPWYVAIHQSGEDFHNPHVHIVIRDRSVDTGKRVLELSENKSTLLIREKWEIIANKALEEAGINARIDRRSLEEQGIDKIPTIHEGAKGQHITKHKKTPPSKERSENTWRKRYRNNIPYPDIDQGRSRAARNAEIMAQNKVNGTRSKGSLSEAMFKKQKVITDRDLSRRIAAREKRRVEQQENIKTLHEEKRQKLLLKRAERAEEVRQSSFRKRQEALSSLERGNDILLQALQDKHGKFSARVFAVIDITGVTRKHREKEKNQLTERYKEKQSVISIEHDQTAKQSNQDVLNEADKEFKTAYESRTSHLQAIRQHHKQEREQDQKELQALGDFERNKAIVELAECSKALKNMYRHTDNKDRDNDFSMEI